MQLWLASTIKVKILIMSDKLSRQDALRILRKTDLPGDKVIPHNCLCA